MLVKEHNNDGEQCGSKFNNSGTFMIKYTKDYMV